MGPRMDARVEAALYYHGILLAIKASFGDTELMFYVLTRSIMTEVGLSPPCCDIDFCRNVLA
jgi:hypothetical protein